MSEGLRAPCGLISRGSTRGARVIDNMHGALDSCLSAVDMRSSVVHFSLATDEARASRKTEVAHVSLMNCAVDPRFAASTHSQEVFNGAQCVTA